jgi:transposase
MASKRRKYTPEFKAEAVKLVLEQGMSRAQVSRDLGVPESVLCRWVQLAEERSAPAGAGLSTSEREELVRLRQENGILRKERDILKKAAAFFAKETL